MIRPGTVAFSDWDQPQWTDLNDFEVIATSPNIDANRVAALHAKDQLVLAYWAPFVHAMPDGAPDRGWPLYSNLWDVVLKYGDARVKDSNAKPIELAEDGMDDYFLIDFSVPGVAQGIASVVGDLPVDGAIFDWGGADLSFMNDMQGKTMFSGFSWPAWGGWWWYCRTLIHQIRPEWQRWAAWNAPTPEGRLLLESVGMYRGVTKYSKALDLSLPTDRVGLASSTLPRNIILCQTSYVQDRRMIAAIALVTRSLFSWRDFNAGPARTNLRDPEHFKLDLGPVRTGPLKQFDGCYLTQYERGFAAVNLGTQTFAISATKKIPPGACMVAQTRDANAVTLPEAKWIVA